MGASHASKGGRRWRYYVSRAALTGRSQDAGSVVRIPASEIENRVAHAVGVHLVTQASAIDECHINHSVLGGDQAIPQHERARRFRRDTPTENDVRNAIERATVGATRIEILLSKSVVADRLCVFGDASAQSVHQIDHGGRGNERTHRSSRHALPLLFQQLKHRLLVAIDE